MNYELRPALWEDNPFLEVLYADVHAQDLASLSLTETDLQQIVALRFKAERMALAARFPDADHNIIWVGEHRIGRILLNQTPDEVRLADITLLPALRGAGVGTSIIEQLQTYATERGLPLRLSVPPQNPATGLFERFGFVIIGTETNRIDMEWKAPPLISNEK